MARRFVSPPERRHKVLRLHRYSSTPIILVTASGDGVPATLGTIQVSAQYLLLTVQDFHHNTAMLDEYLDCLKALGFSLEILSAGGRATLREMDV